MGERYCVGGKSSTYSKGMMQSMLFKCWTELLWQSDSLQLGFVVCSFRLQLERVMKARYESRVKLMPISINKWRRFFFFSYKLEEWNTSMEVKNVSDSWQRSHISV